MSVFIYVTMFVSYLLVLVQYGIIRIMYCNIIKMIAIYYYAPGIELGGI